MSKRPGGGTRMGRWVYSVVRTILVVSSAVAAVSSVAESAGNKTNDEVANKIDPESARKSEVWHDLKNKIRSDKNKEPARKHHFCPLCGFISGQKYSAFLHAKKHHIKTHPNFHVNDAIQLNNVEKYYQTIAKLKRPCGDAKHFLKQAHKPMKKPVEKQTAPSSIKKSQAWVDVNNRIKKAKTKSPSCRPHFCPLCCFVCCNKGAVLRHAKMQHKKSHPNFDVRDAIPLKSVEKYYETIMNLDSPCEKVQYFMKAVHKPAPKLTEKQVLPSSVKNSNVWRDLKTKIKKTKNGKPSKRPHWCPLCGFVASDKTCLFRHAKRHHHKTHPDFHANDAILLKDVEEYYHAIKKYKNLHEEAMHFLSVVNQQPQTSSKPSKSNDNKNKRWKNIESETKPILERKRRRKHTHPRKLPSSVICAERFLDEEFSKKKHKPSGCENEITIKTEPESDDDALNIKTEPEDI